LWRWRTSLLAWVSRLGWGRVNIVERTFPNAWSLRKGKRLNINVEGPFLATSSICEPVLRSLPQWFGIEAANVQYLQDIEELPTFLAQGDGGVTGFLTIREHNEYAAEIHIVGVRPEAHRQGIGRALLAEAERYLAQRGIEYLQVKTLSPAHPDQGYARTRAFYRAMGFRPLEEFPELWGPENPCLLMVKYLGDDCEKA